MIDKPELEIPTGLKALGMTFFFGSAYHANYNLKYTRIYAIIISKR